MKTQHILIAAFVLFTAAAYGKPVKPHHALNQKTPNHKFKTNGNYTNLTSEIAHMDSVLFSAFNSQDIETTRKVFATDVEFFHDKDGLGLYQKTMENFEALYKNSKVNGLRRDLVPGSLEVYPIKGYGAVEIGEHHFCHTENGAQDCANFKFAIIWKNTNGNWQVTRAISYGHVNAVEHTDPLYKTVADLDKQMLDAFNTRKLAVMGNLFSPGVEFYQDNEGVEDYAQTMTDFKTLFANNAGNGLRRDIIPGTLEVYPIKDYGAIELGEHKFCHVENGAQDCGTFKFLHVWKNDNGHWKITRVISYGH